jgi:hypothetical protein
MPLRHRGTREDTIAAGHVFDWVEVALIGALQEFLRQQSPILEAALAEPSPLTKQQKQHGEQSTKTNKNNKNVSVGKH